MKKQLIAVGLAGLLTIPAVSFGAEMAGPNLYGSFKAGLTFGSGDTAYKDFGSRWGFKGSYEISEGLTASYNYEARLDTGNAESGGGYDEILASTTTALNANGPLMDVEDPDAEADAADNRKYVSAGGPGGRHANMSLSGGFGTVSLGQMWSATANHYGFAVDPSLWAGSFGGATYRPGNTVSYSSIAGDVSFQIDKIFGDKPGLEFGASAALGPVGLGLGYWSKDDNDSGFTGVAISAGASGVSMTVGLGSTDSIDTSILHIGGALGDSGVSYGVQITNSDDNSIDQNLVILTNSLGAGASIIFEHLSPGEGDSSSLIALVVGF